MNKENLSRIMDEFDNLLANSEEIETYYEDEDGKHYGTVDWICIEGIRHIYYKLEKELEDVLC